MFIAVNFKLQSRVDIKNNCNLFGFEVRPNLSSGDEITDRTTSGNRMTVNHPNCIVGCEDAVKLLIHRHFRVAFLSLTSL